MKPVATIILTFWLAGMVSACTLGTGQYVHHPNPGIDQVQCPPPARPECGTR